VEKDEGGITSDNCTILPPSNYRIYIQVSPYPKGNVTEQISFIARLFGVAA
jgi:hypothetical protein